MESWTGVCILRKESADQRGESMIHLNTDSSYIMFRDAVNSDIFVDKSMMIGRISGKIRTTDRYLCITRPRRFGKTMNAHMLGAYYTKGIDSKEMFDRLRIAETEEYPKHRNSHNVIFADMSRIPDVCRGYQDYIAAVVEGLREDLQEVYPFLRDKKYTSVSHMFQDSGESFIFIFDEWDSIFYQDFMTDADKAAYLSFLRNLLKDQPYVDLAYMTGVLPIAKYSSGSELNMFDEYNFMNDTVYDTFFGFSEREVRSLCEEHTGGLTFEDLKKWYDGYHLGNGESLFNPRSVAKALSRGVCLNYWTETGPMNEIADCIEHNVSAVREDVVKMIAGIPVAVDLQGYSAAELQLNTRDEILSAMVVFGFLSYHDGYLRIPNYELMEKYQRVLARDSMEEIKEIVESSKGMLEATLAQDSDRVAGILEKVHDREIPFLQYNDENALSCVVTLCYLYARKDYYVEREAKSGKGYCDYLFLPKKKNIPAIILELKVNDTCEAALRQIKDRDYAARAKEYAGGVLLVGIGYDKDKKKHSCIIERFF